MSKAYKGTVLDEMSLSAEELVASSRDKDLIKQVHEGMSLINKPVNPEDFFNSLLSGQSEAVGNPQGMPSGQIPPTGVARPIQGMFSQPGLAQSQSRYPSPQKNTYKEIKYPSEWIIY